MFADDRAIENDGTDADQRTVANAASMQHGLMADDDIAADGQADAGIGVQYGVILNVAACADGDEIGVAANHGAKKYAGFGFEDHRANDGGGFGNPGVVVTTGFLSPRA